MKNENYDDIKKLFDEDIELPESLSKENIVKKIKENGVKPEKKKNIKAFPRFLATAAAFVIVAAGAFAVYERSADSKRPVSFEHAKVSSVAQLSDDENAEMYSEIDVGTEKPSLSKFKSEKDLKNYFLNLKKKNKRNIDLFNGKGNDQAAGSNDRVPGASPTNTYALGENIGTSDSTASKNYGKTNTQVDGVDEADIIKNDGTYLYSVSHGRLSIIDAKTMKLVSQKEFEPSDSKKRIFIEEIYINGNRLVATGAEIETSQNNSKDKADDDYFFGWNEKKENSVSLVFDISDRTNPKELRRVVQDGRQVSSRMVGTCLYTATVCDALSKESEKDGFVPKVNSEKVALDEIYVEKKKDNNASYLILTGYDTADEKSEIDKASVISSGYEVYCSRDTFYVSSNEYSETLGRLQTNIHAFLLKNGKVSYKASASVPGRVDNQYMMDQNGEYLRVATNDYDYKKDTDISSLYILDGKLNVIGKLKDIANDEQIKSVRFMGNTAYVVTFKNTDPLFAIDLSKPNEPKILGSVKLPGFSSYLHPLSENLLVGIGYDGDEEKADFGKVKISLFDVSDKKNPKEVASHIVKNAYCMANDSPKSFLTIDENTFGIPLQYNIENDDDYITKYIFKTFTVSDGKFVEKNSYIHSGNTGYTAFFRGTFIGNYIYTIDGETVKQFDMKSEKELSALDYVTDEEAEDSIDVYNIFKENK